MSEVEVLVIGTGVAGLAAARRLEAAGREVLAVDVSDRPGGVMRTDSADGYRFECGPNTVLVKAPMRAFLEQQGLLEALIPATPESSKRFVYRDEQLFPVPMDPLAFLRTPLLSGPGKWRLLAEPFLRGGDPGGESVAEFVARRMGRETVDGLVGPFLTGVYAGDEDQLGAEAVFPSLVALERASGSIVRGALAAGLRRSLGREPRPERGLRGAWSGSQGLGGFALELAAGLRGGVQLETRAVSLRPEEGGWRVELVGPSGEQRLRASAVVLATPSREAAELLRDCHPEAARILDAIRYAPVVAVAVGADRREVRRPIEGFGFLVPRAEKLGLLGCLFMSRLFPGRAPEGRELLHCMLGGTRWPEAAETPDDQLAKGVHEDLDRSLGLRSQLPILAIRRWPRAVAQPGRSHLGKVASLRRLLAATPGLQLAGSYLDGVSVSDALASGARAAEEMLSL